MLGSLFNIILTIKISLLKQLCTKTKKIFFIFKHYAAVAQLAEH